MRGGEGDVRGTRTPVELLAVIEGKGRTVDDALTRLKSLLTV